MIDVDRLSAVVQFYWGVDGVSRCLVLVKGGGNGCRDEWVFILMFFLLSPRFHTYWVLTSATSESWRGSMEGQIVEGHGLQHAGGP